MVLQIANRAIRPAESEEEHAPADLIGDEAGGDDRAGADEGAGALHHQELARRTLR